MLATELRSEIAELRSEMTQLGSALRADMAEGQRRLTIQLVMVIVTLNGILTGLVAALA